MAYRIISQRRAWWPVTFPGVSEEGDVVENRFEMRFNLLDEDAHIAFLNDASALGSHGSKEMDFGEAALPFVRRMADNWRGVEAENGDALPFTDENIALLVKQPGVWPAIARGYASCRKAEPEIREKN